VRKVVTGLYHAANEAVPMVEAFLDASNLEQEGGMKYEKLPCNLKEIAEQVVREEQFAAEEKELVLSFSAAGDELFAVQGDANKLKQVFYNLVDNAIKYTPTGSISVMLARADGKIVFSVKDTGVGIPQPEVQKLFKKFSRAEGAARVNVSSTGLGLYLASEFVKAHGGKIWTESDGAGKGATFFVELPTI
jgi:signal transduction histidine kinase